MFAQPKTDQVSRYFYGLFFLCFSYTLQAKPLTSDHGSIDVKITRDYIPESLLVLIDSQDITAFAKPTKSGLSITPPQLPEGSRHILQLSFTTVEGYDIRRRIELLNEQESYYNSATGLGLIVRAKLHDKNDLNQQDYEVDANLEHQGAWRHGLWNGDVNADIWYLDRGTDIEPFDDKQAEVIDYYASAKYSNDRKNFLTEAGYIQLNESRNTIYQLARRGAHASLQGESLSMDIFSVNSQQHLGSEGGVGLGDDSENTIAGLSAGWVAVDSSSQTLKLKAIYSDGSESGDSLGILSNNTANKGDVAGLLIESTFNNLGMTLEVEMDRSSYDADTSDTVDSIDDDAYGLRLRGQSGSMKYHAAFEHIGTNYAVVANPLLQNDREYLTMAASFDRGEHGFALQVQVEHDNLDNELTRSQLNKTYLTADYRFRKGRHLSTFLSLQTRLMESSDEPTIADKRDSNTNSILGKLSYSSNNWNNQFSLLLSDLSDKLDNTNDSQIVSFSYSPALATQQLYFTPSLSFTETEFNSGQKTQLNMLSIYVQGKAFSNKLDYQLSTSVSALSDNTNDDIDSASLIARSYWTFGNINTQADKARHSIGLELEYYDSDTAGTETQNDSIAWLVYSIKIGNRS